MYVRFEFLYSLRLDSTAATTINKTYSCNWPEKLCSRFLGQSGDFYTTYSKMAKIFNTIEVLHGGHVSWHEQHIFFFLTYGEKMFFQMKTFLLFLLCNMTSMQNLFCVNGLIVPCCCLVFCKKIFGILQMWSRQRGLNNIDIKDHSKFVVSLE